MKTRISVLLVEESQTFAMYLAILLQRMGFKSLRVSQPESAKFVLSRGFTDILIVGDHDGPEKTHEIVRELGASIVGNSIPIIVLSKHDDPVERQACLEAGCQDYLLKPVQPKQLHDALHAQIQPFPERRVNLRSQVNMLAEVRIEGEPTQETHILSLSRGGALVACNHTLPTGWKVSMTLRLGEIKIPLVGSVLYNLTDPETKIPSAFGLLFHQISLTHADFIDDYLQAMLQESRLVSSAARQDLQEQRLPSS